MQNAPIAATMEAIITGTNSRRSSLVGIGLALHRFRGSSSAGIGFEIVNSRRLNLHSACRRINIRDRRQSATVAIPSDGAICAAEQAALS
jgi:hypothetical protein